MIAGMIRGNILETPHRHIAFAINTDGAIEGFAGKVAIRTWLKLFEIGEHSLGETFSHKAIDGRTYHALVCHTLDKGGWDETPKMVTKCLDALDVPDGEPIAIVAIGTGTIGALGGANEEAILKGMEASKKKVVVYYL